MTAQPLPAGFVQSAAHRLGDQLGDFLVCYEAEPLRGIRLNPLKPMSGEIPVDGLGEPVPWAASAYFLSGGSLAGSHPLHEAGAWYIQEPSAMLPAAVLNARPGETVLDLCAAPGGKSTQMAASMGGKGLLVCSEPVPSRAQILSRNIERMGITNALVLCAWPDELAARWPGCFDAVLADAPCSGEGMFRREPESRKEWTPAAPQGCAIRQAAILDAAASLLRPGGRLVYATCTLNEIENEDTVKAFLSRHPDFRLCPFCLPDVSAPEGCFTCWPHLFRGEGQFCALLVRDGDEPPLPFPRAELPRPPKDAFSLLGAFAAGAPEPTAALGNTMIHMNACLDLRGLRVLRCGLHLGTVSGSRFRPDHAWAVSQTPPALPRIALDVRQALRYQAGEAIQTDEKVSGWALPELNGLPLGFCKVSGGQMKNHYPKGLRRALR